MVPTSAYTFRPIQDFRRRPKEDLPQGRDSNPGTGLLGSKGRRAKGRLGGAPATPARNGQRRAGRRGRDLWYREETKGELHTQLPQPPEFPERIETVRERIARVIGRMSVPRSVQTWHPLIDALLKEDERRREQLRSDPYPMSWNKPKFDTPPGRRGLRILNSMDSRISAEL